MERREELLRAAAKVYARHGYRGSTTRRIADEAGVNEITIFRQFGTKDALIHEAIACGGLNGPLAELPAVPVDPHAELQQWTATIRSHIYASRMLMRRCMSEREEHPQLSASANRGPLRAAADLQSYFGALKTHGFLEGDVDAKAAAAMLIGTIFSDAIGRDATPDIYPATPAVAVEQYTTLILRAIGMSERKPRRRSSKNGPHSAVNNDSRTAPPETTRDTGASSLLSSSR
jgi:AcrR family transcriptional regulator